VLPFLLDGFLHFIELLAVPANQHDSAVLGHLQCREASYTGGRTGDDVRFAIGRVFQTSVRHICLRLVVCLVSLLSPKKLGEGICGTFKRLDSPVISALTFHRFHALLASCDRGEEGKTLAIETYFPLSSPTRQGRKTAAGCGGAIDVLLEESECRKYTVSDEAKGGGVGPGKTKALNRCRDIRCAEGVSAVAI
jgi:hypothetical protein